MPHRGNKENSLIIEYWFRTLCNLSLSIVNIISIIAEYAKEYETIDLSISYKGFSYNEDTCIISMEYLKEDEDELEAQTGFGTVVATAGRKYHWTLKLIGDGPGWQYNIGVLDEETAIDIEKSRFREGFWFTKAGYSYYGGTGKVYNGDIERNCVEYGETYKGGDVIDLWLDLKDTNNAVYWGKNGKQYDKKVNVKSNTDYRFAFCVMPGELELLLFETE